MNLLSNFLESERSPTGMATVPEPDNYRPRIVPPSSPSDEISKAQALLAAGSIDENEFAAIKARALA